MTDSDSPAGRRDAAALAAYHLKKSDTASTFPVDATGVKPYISTHPRATATPPRQETK